MYHWIIHNFWTFSTEQNRQKDPSVSANFVGNTLTQSEAIETYTPYNVTSSRPRKTTIAFFASFGGIEKIILRAEPELKCENYESVQYRLQFSGIKKGAKISFHRHFKGAHSRLNGLKSLAKLFNFVFWQSVSIFSILNHSFSFMVYYHFWRFSIIVKYYFQVSFNLMVMLSMLKITQNTVTKPL